MENKVALVVGGSGGIGISTAEQLIGKGIKVCLTYFKNEEKVKEKIENLTDVELFQMDVSDGNSISDCVRSILEKYKKIDYIIYSVSGGIDNKKVLDLEWGDFQDHIDVQIKGLFSLTKNLSTLINENHKIKFVVVLTEYCIGKPPSRLAHYVTAKYGLMGFVKSMASELARNNCTFNMVSPGMVDTDLLSNLPSKLVELTAHQNPMKRIAKPIDVANVIMFLVSDESDYLNGVNIPVNGGNLIV